MSRDKYITHVYLISAFRLLKDIYVHKINLKFLQKRKVSADKTQQKPRMIILQRKKGVLSRRKVAMKQFFALSDDFSIFQILENNHNLQYAAILGVPHLSSDIIAHQVLAVRSLISFLIIWGRF